MFSINLSDNDNKKKPSFLFIVQSGNGGLFPKTIGRILVVGRVRIVKVCKEKRKMSCLFTRPKSFTIEKPGVGGGCTVSRGGVGATTGKDRRRRLWNWNTQPTRFVGKGPVKMAAVPVFFSPFFVMCLYYCLSIYTQ